MKSQENSQLRPHPNLEPLRPWPLWCSPLGLQPDRSPKFGVVFKKRKKDWNRYMDIDGYWYYWYMDTEWYNVYFCVCTDFMDIGSQLPYCDLNLSILIMEYYGYESILDGLVPNFKNTYITYIPYPHGYWVGAINTSQTFLDGKRISTY